VARRHDRAEAERAEHRQLEAADGVGEVRERVRARVAVRWRVGERADAAGVDHEHERAP
jgi:hypothetical protein